MEIKITEEKIGIFFLGLHKRKFDFDMKRSMKDVL